MSVGIAFWTGFFTGAVSIVLVSLAYGKWLGL